MIFTGGSRSMVTLLGRSNAQNGRGGDRIAPSMPLPPIPRAKKCRNGRLELLAASSSNRPQSMLDARYGARDVYYTPERDSGRST